MFKKIVNAFRDFLYNITDYGIIITVVLIMGFVLLWRFDVLFGREIEKIPSGPTDDVIVLNPTPDPIPVTPPAIGVEPNNPVDPNASGNDPQTPDDKPKGKVATINIPPGTYPSSIGDILVTAGIITDKKEFLNKAVEMKLDTKLKSGEFNITIGTSLEEVIKILAYVK